MPDTRDVFISYARPSEEEAHRIAETTEIRHLEADPDLDSIRDDSRFKTMLASAKQRLRLIGLSGPRPAKRAPSPPALRRGRHRRF